LTGGKVTLALTEKETSPLRRSKPTVDFHSLRHTFLTNLARAGVHPKTAQAPARHSAISLTLDRHTHISPGDEVQAIGSLPALRASTGPPGPSGKLSAAFSREVSHA